MPQPDDEVEQAFLRSFARSLGLDELSPGALASSLGLDELTPEKLDRWFEEQAAPRRGSRSDVRKGGERVVQVDPPSGGEPPPSSTLPGLPPRRGRGD